MKVYTLEELSKRDFIIKNISAILQKPVWRKLEVDSRICNGFMSVVSGECVYMWENNKEILKKNDIIYLPINSKHKAEVLQGELSFYRIDFNIFTPDGEEIIFSKKPVIYRHNADAVTIDILSEMTKVFLQDNGYYKMCSLLHRFLSIMEKPSADRSIKNVIEYINNNFTYDFTIADLANMCYLSRAQMYRIFEKELKMSPIEYRNHLRIERAKTMLRNKVCTVGEAAEILGFENIYYFSRVFKKYTGLSPGKYK